MLTKAEFLKAWEDWDKNPSGEYTASRMEDACGELAAALNCSVVNLRVLLAEERRGNAFHEDIVDSLFLLVDSGVSL